MAGYHPFSEDGGIYVAGIRKLLDPILYPAWTEFVTEHLRFSLFAPFIASLVRWTHLRLEIILLFLYAGSIWATLYGGWMLAARATQVWHARCGAVTLFACWLTLPIAGTSLMLVDPYLTARSLSTPLLLMALAWTLDATSGAKQAWLSVAVAVGAAAALHPLMAAYGLAAVLMLCAVRPTSRAARRWGQFSLMALALAVAAAIQWRAPAESSDYVQVALTRYYWFPIEWRWFEWLGLIAPLGLLHWLRSLRPRSAWRDLAQAATQLGLISFLVAWFFARSGSSTHLVARLQPLRTFQTVYEIMILLLGAWLGEHILKTVTWRWTVLLLVMGPLMFYAQFNTYPNSGRIEWPWNQPVNQWEQAFLWVRDHTPKDALFALDAQYITRGRHEDAQCFRAIAERSALPDYSKDGGEASITPNLTGPWIIGQTAQRNLESESDQQRVAKLRPLGVSWIVLKTSSLTGWTCPYTNPVVKVCRLP